MKLKHNEKYLGQCRGLIYLEDLTNHTIIRFREDNQGNRIPYTRNQNQKSDYVVSFVKSSEGIASYELFKSIYPNKNLVKMNRCIGTRFNSGGNPHHNGWCASQYATFFDVYARTK